jgi:hypothetical protein
MSALLACVLMSAMIVSEFRDDDERDFLAAVAIAQCPTVVESLLDLEQRGVSPWDGAEYKEKLRIIHAEQLRSLQSAELKPRLIRRGDEMFVRVPHTWRLTQPDEVAHVHISGSWTGGKTAAFRPLGIGVSVFIGEFVYHPVVKSLGTDEQQWHAHSPYLLSVVRLEHTDPSSRKLEPIQTVTIAIAPDEVLVTEQESHPIAFGAIAGGIGPIVPWPQDVFDAELTVRNACDCDRTLVNVIISRPYDKWEALFTDRPAGGFRTVDYSPLRELRGVEVGCLRGEVRWIRRPSTHTPTP